MAKSDKKRRGNSEQKRSSSSTRGSSNGKGSGSSSNTEWWRGYNAATQTGTRSGSSGRSSSGSRSTSGRSSGGNTGGSARTQSRPAQPSRGSGISTSFDQWQKNRQQAANQAAKQRYGTLSDSQRRNLAASVYKNVDKDALWQQADEQKRQMQSGLQELQGGGKDTADFRKQLYDYERTMRQVNSWYNTVIWDDELYDSTKRDLQAMQDSYDQMFGTYKGLRDDYNRQYQSEAGRRQNAAPDVNRLLEDTLPGGGIVTDFRSQNAGTESRGPVQTAETRELAAQKNREKQKMRAEEYARMMQQMVPGAGELSGGTKPFDTVNGNPLIYEEEHGSSLWRDAENAISGNRVTAVQRREAITEATQRRDEAAQRMNAVSGGRGPTAQAEYDKAKADYDKWNGAIARWAGKAYTASNQEARQALEADKQALALYDAVPEYDRQMAELEELRRSRMPSGGRITEAEYAQNQQYLQQIEQLRAQRQQALQDLKDAGYDYEALRQYEDWVQRQQEAAERSQTSAQYAREHPVAASAASVLGGAVQGTDFIGAVLGNLGHSDPTQADYIPLTAADFPVAGQTEAMQGTVAGMIEDGTDAEILGTNVASFLYNTGISIANNLAMITAFGPAAGLFMGANAASSQAKNVVERGGTSQQAILGGLAVGAAEMLFEKVSIDNLLQERSVDSLRALLRETAKQAGVEASEETFTEIANIISDAAIMKDNSDWQRGVRSYMDSGMSRGDAIRQQLLDSIGQVALAGAGGAISGGVMGGTMNALNYAGSSPAARAQNMNPQQHIRMSDGAETGATGNVAAEVARNGQQRQQAGALEHTMQEQGYDGESRVVAQRAQQLQNQNEASFARQWDAARSYGREGVSLEYAKGSRAVDGLSEVAVEAAWADGQRAARDGWTQEERRLGAEGRKQLRALQQQADGQQNAAQLREEFAQSYQAGLTGAKLEQRTALSQTQQQAAWNAGKADSAATLQQGRQNVQQATTAQDSGLVYDQYVLQAMQRGSATHESGAQLTRETAKQLDTLSKSLGVRVQFVDQVAGGSANASITGSTIRIERGNPHPVRFLLGHELTHRIQELAPDEYRVFRDAVAQERSSEVAASLALYERQGMQQSYEGAMDEAAADYAGRLMEGGRTLDDFIARNQGNRTLLQRVRDAIRSFIGKLTGAERRQAQTAEEKLTQALRAAQRQAENLAAENKNAAQEGDGVRYSVKADGDGREETQAEITAEYQQSVHDILNGTTSTNGALLVGYTPEVYLKLGMPDLPFVVGGGHVYSMAKTASEASADGKFRRNTNYHGLGESVVADIMEFVKDPVMVISAKDVNRNAAPMRSTHSVVALVDVGTGKDSMVIPIAITAERTLNGVRMDVNAISSAYEKNTAGLVNEAIAQFNAGENSVFYVKKEAANLLGAGVQFPEQLKAAASSNGIIRRLDSKINMSTKKTTESQQFKRWFGDWQNHPESASKVVDEDGTPMVVHHGTAGDFNSFASKNGAYFFSRSTDYAESMAEERGGSRVIDAYLDIRNPLYVKMKPTEFSDPNYEGKYIRQAKSAGNDGVIFELNTGNEIVDDTFYVVFQPTQIKSSDNNVGTFDRGTEDIRYSRKGTSIDKEYEALLRERDALKERVNYWRGQTKRTASATTDRNAVARSARELISNYGAQLQTEEIRPELQRLYDFMASGKDGRDELTYEAVRERAEGIAQKVVNSAVAQEDELYRSYKDLRDYLRGTKLTISEADSRDIPDFGDFRKRNFGRMNVSRGEGNIDTVYQELQQQWPEFFDEARYSTPSDQLQQISEVLDRVYTITEGNPFSGYSSQAVAGIANEIMDNFFELPQTRATFADRQAQKLDEAKAKGKEQLQRARQQTREQKQELTRQRREAVQQAILGEKMAAGKQLEKLKREYQAKGKEQRETQQRRELAAKITRHAKALSKKLLRPTDAQHIPQELRTVVAQALESINQSSGRDYDQNLAGEAATKRTQAWDALAEQYRQAAQDDSVGLVVDPALLSTDETGRTLFQRVRDAALTPVDRRTQAQLADTWKLLRVLETSISKAGKTLSRTKFESTQRWASALEADTATRIGRTRNIAYDMETPYTFFSRYGQAGMEIYRMLRNAQDQRQLYSTELNRQVQEIVTPKQAQQWQKERHQFTTERGQTLELNTAQLMELRELMARPQAAEHILRGGVMQPELRQGGKRVARGTEAVLLSEADIDAMLRELTPEQVQAADKLQALTTGALAQWGNQASMAAYGYEKFADKHYWPIRAATEEVHSRTEHIETNARSIKNIGLAQAVQPHASNAVELPGLFDTFARHSADMMDYAAWLLPMEDANRLFNYQYRDALGNRTGRTVKGMLDRYGGSGAQKYWNRLMANIQNGLASPQDSEWAQAAQRVIGNAKGAAVGGNIRVVIQQPTAFLRANAVLNPGDLAAGLVKGVIRGNGWQKALQWAPIAQIKDAGSFDIGSARSMQTELFGGGTKLERFNEAMGWGAGKADAVTWGKLWNACEHEVARTQKNLTPGSDAFYRKVAQRFTETIDATQVVDGVLQRSQMMRSRNMLNKMATAFMGEPTMSMNLLMRTAESYLYENNKSKRAKALKQVGRAATALLVTDVVNALAQSLIDAVRDDDRDKDYWQRYWAALTGQSGDEKNLWEKTKSFLGSNVFSNMDPVERIPYAKDALTIWQGYDVTRADADVIADVVNAVKTAQASFSGSGAKTRGYALEQLAKNVGKLFGVSAGNLLRDAYAFARSMAQASGSIPLQYELEKVIYSYTSEKNANRYMDILYDAGKQTDPSDYDHIRQELLSGGAVDEGKLASGMTSRIRSDYEDGNITRERAAALLQQLAGLDAGEAEHKLSGWALKQEQGFNRSEMKQRYLSGQMERDQAVKLQMEYNGKTQQEAEEAVLGWDVEDVKQDYDDGAANEAQAVKRLQALGYDTDEAEAKVLGWQKVNETGSSNIWADYADGKIDRQDAIDWRVKYDGKTRQEAEAEAAAKDFKLDNPEYEEYSDTQIGKYLDLQKRSRIDANVYFDFYDALRGMESKKDANGKAIDGQSKKDQGMAYIDRLPLSRSQKDALYLTQWKESTIDEAPWH